MADVVSSAILAHASIRLRVLVATAVLALGGLGFAGTSLHDAMQDHARAEQLQAASGALAALSHATIDLSLERSVSQVSIEMNVPVTPVLRKLIDQQRAKADAQFDVVQTQIATLATTTRIDEFARRLAGLRGKLAPIRQEFDRLAAMPPALRPVDVATLLPRELKAAVVEFQALRHLLRGVGFLLPTQVAILETVRDQAWQIREFGGRERTYLAVAAFNRAPIRPTRLEEMGVLARRAADAWLDIRTLMQHDGLSPAVQTAAAAIGQGYYGAYDRVRTAMLAQAGTPTPAYPSFEAFFEQSSEALGGVEALAFTASADIDAFWAARATATLRTVLVDAAAGLLLALGGGVCGWVTVGVFRRLDGLRGRMERLAGGDVASEVPDVDAPNEVGAMARALLVFRETARERLGLEEDAARTRAAKDRSQSATEQHMRDFTESLAGVMHNLSGAAKRMDVASGRMANAAARTGDLARATTRDATASAQDLVMVAGATEQLSASVAEISGQVARAATTAHAMTGRAGVTEQTMSGLSDAAGRVGNVARLIEAIAGQTNLLALNATIEAARAGAAGKGFAVVAAEVKQLAARTTAATGEIGSQIDQIQAATQGAVAAVRQMAADIRQMEEMAAAIAAAVEQQGAGVRNIAGSIASVTQATECAVGAMGESVLAADDARTTSDDVREAAAHVGRESDMLGQEVQEFLRNLSTDRSDQRQHERRPGHDLPIEARFANGTRVSGLLVDISNGGLAFTVDGAHSTLDATAGMQVAVTLPGLAAPIPMRLVRAVDGVVGLVARQEPGVVEQLGAVMAALTSPAANQEHPGHAMAA